MNEEFQALHHKLDHLLAELTIIKAGLLSRGGVSPPLTLRQAAAYLHLSESRVYDLVYTGRVIPLQHGKHSRLLFSKENLNQYLYEYKLSKPTPAGNPEAARPQQVDGIHEQVYASSSQNSQNK